MISKLKRREKNCIREITLFFYDVGKDFFIVRGEDEKAVEGVFNSFFCRRLQKTLIRFSR